MHGILVQLPLPKQVKDTPRPTPRRLSPRLASPPRNESEKKRKKKASPLTHLVVNPIHLTPILTYLVVSERTSNRLPYRSCVRGDCLRRFSSRAVLPAALFRVRSCISSMPVLFVALSRATSTGGAVTPQNIWTLSAQPPPQKKTDRRAGDPAGDNAFQGR